MVELIKKHDQQIKEMDQVVNTLIKDDGNGSFETHQVNGVEHSHRRGAGLCDLRLHELIQDIWQEKMRESTMFISEGE